MRRRLTLPDSASFTIASEDGRLFAPSAARNLEHIVELVKLHAPAKGEALEIASGTGEHIVHLAKTLPALTWQPTDLDRARRASIDAHAAAAGMSNLRPSMELDATAPDWGHKQNVDLILLVNLLHLIDESEAKRVITGAAQALNAGGVFIIYGPFLRDGETTSEGDAAFHASLQAQDPTIGYKDDWDVIEWLHGAWLELVQVVEMPANNLAFVARKPA